MSIRSTAPSSTPVDFSDLAILKSLVDAAGDLLVGTADNTVGRLAKGTAYQRLRTNAGATALEWGSPGTVLLDEVTLGSAAATIDFTNIPSGFKDLKVVARLRSDRSASPNDSANLRLGNSSAIDFTSGNYRWHTYRLGDSNLEGAGFSSQTFITTGEFIVPGSTATAAAWAQLEFEILDYTDTTFNRQVQGQSGAWQTSSARRMAIFHGEWLNTSDAVARLQLLLGFGNFIAGSKARLYGIA